MKRKYLKLSALILSVSALTVLSSCETSARYIGSNSWEGTVTQTYHGDDWYGLSQSDLSTTDSSTLWSIINGGSYSKFYLTEDITLTAADYAIWIQKPGITLCLHGHTINAYSGAGTSETEGVISIKDGSDNGTTTHGSLTLEDCVGGGKITGGNDVYNDSWGSGGSGGGISVNGSDCSLIMNGGIIEGNSTQYKGGGIYNYAGYVEINGGSIKNNAAGQEGGGIYNDQGKLVINGGEISGNSADDGGGIYSDCDSTSDSQGLYIKGGTISGNSATYDAGGVKFEHFVASEEDETVYQETESTLHLSGSPYIYDNYATQNEESIQYNVETDELSLLAFDDALTDGAKIGVTYSGDKASNEPPYQISVAETSTTYTQSSAQYIVSDVEYYETKYDDTGNYLVLDGVDKFDTVATASITLIFDFVHSGDTTPLDSTSSSGKLILPTTEDGEDYARIFIEGSWDNYETEYNLTLDPDTESYYVTLTDLTINYHSFYIYVGYLDNDDHIPLSDDNPEFTFMVPLEVDSLADSGVYTIEFKVESENEFSDLVSEEEDVHKVNFTLQFKLWQGWGSSEQQPLEYGDLYVWTSMNEWSGWMKCYVQADGWDEDGNVISSHYYLDVDNLEVGEYEYSLVIWYNDEEIPDPEEDTSVWDRKVNVGGEGEDGTNNIFTVTDDVLADNDDLGYIPIEVNNTTNTLANLLPFRLKDYTFTFKFTSDGSNVTTCPDYGSLYINGDFEQGSDSWVQDYYELTLNADGETYSVTIPTLMPGEMEFNILFVYDGDNPSGAWGTQQLFADNETLTIDSSSGNYYERETETYNLGFDLETQFPELGATLDSYTLIFSIYKDTYNQGSNGQSSNNWNVYIAGSYPGSEWIYADLCAWTSDDGGSTVTFVVTLSGLVQGQTYTYKLLYADYYTADRHEISWSYPQITGDDQTLEIPTDAEDGGTQEITIESDIWFNNPYYTG